ncbi:MAG TPA: serine--tRNA ligase [Candidatus Acidoferrum sp.]|nr:serine--tRNA ligase [Candidatus Acidoferrum sp.]
MLDIKLIRDRPDFVRRRLASRAGGDEAHVDEILQLDEQRRKALAEVEALKAERNRISKEIGALRAQAKASGFAGIGMSMSGQVFPKQIEAGLLNERIAALDKQAAESESARNRIMLGLPNLPHESVHEGKGAEENREVRAWGRPPEMSFPRKKHVELCEKLGLVDFARAAKLSGSGFVLYTNWGARLERALIQFMLDLHTSEHGYTEVSPPFMVGPQCLEGVGQFPKFRDQYYGVAEGDDPEKLHKLYLIPTAETPVANIHREELLKESDLPKNYCAYTPCFRGEAGAAGVGTRGIIRVHQFDKVELIKVTRPEESYAAHEQMLKDAEDVLQRLGLHYRVVLLCTGDMGFSAAKTYDIEVWAPGQGSYLEVSSVSNCEDFQARRMNLRFKASTGENRFPHLLNGSGTALARLFVALVETFQQSDGSILMPAKLQPYLKAERITA